MKRTAQLALSREGQQVLDHYASALKQGEDLSPVTVRNYLSDLRQFISWCEHCWHNEEEDALVAAVNAYGTLRDRTIIILLLHTGLRAEELCTLTSKQVSIGKRTGTLRIIGKRKKERSVPLNATARSALLKYLETQP